MAPERKIVTSYANPPIPYRNMDWAAWFDDEGAEAGRYGYGETEAEATQDLLDNYEGEA
jgi:hypothetical protein